MSSSVVLAFIIHILRVFRSLSVVVTIYANPLFTEHMTIFGDDGNESADLQVINNKYPLPMKRRIKFEK